MCGRSEVISSCISFCSPLLARRRFEGKTWTDIYEDLRDVAADEIKRAEDYRKKRKLRR